jgi:hypothetical protein
VRVIEAPGYPVKSKLLPTPVARCRSPIITSVAHGHSVPVLWTETSENKFVFWVLGVNRDDREGTAEVRRHSLTVDSQAYRMQLCLHVRHRRIALQQTPFHLDGARGPSTFVYHAVESSVSHAMGSQMQMLGKRDLKRRMEGMMRRLCGRLNESL